MTGCCWRLLVLSLILLPAAFLHGQDAFADRPSARAPAWAASHVPAADSPPADSVRLPKPPVASRPYPVGPIVLPQILQSAGIIFSGRVTSVERAATTFAPDAAFTSVTFQVEHAIRGTAAGQNLTIHEWAGIWARGERYRMGERVLMFLYTPSKLGLTSPVAGAVGKFAIDPHGKVVINASSDAARTTVPYTDFVRAVKHADGREMSQP